MSKYAKFLTALGAAAAVAATAVADGSVTSTEVWGIVLAFVGALGVYAVPNTPKQG